MQPTGGQDVLGRPTVKVVAVEPVGIVEVAEMCGVAEGTARKWRTRGRLPEPRWTVSGSPLWSRADIDAWARETGRLPGSDR